MSQTNSISQTDKLTLDTDTLRNWAWCKNLGQQKRHNNDEAKKKLFSKLFDQLFNLRDSGKCEIGVTTQLFTDHHETNQLPPYIENMIGVYVEIKVPAISTFPIAFPLVFADGNQLDNLFNDVFPSSLPKHKKYESNRLDTLQLYAHMIANRDIFITFDNAILGASKILKSKWDIKVISLEEYLVSLNNH